VRKLAVGIELLRLDLIFAGIWIVVLGRGWVGCCFVCVRQTVRVHAYAVSGAATSQLREGFQPNVGLGRCFFFNGVVASLCLLIRPHLRAPRPV